MKFGQLIEYNMRNIFLKNHTHLVEKLFPEPVLKIKIVHIPRSRVQSFIRFAFIVCQGEDCENILKLRCIPLTCFYLV